MHRRRFVAAAGQAAAWAAGTALVGCRPAMSPGGLSDEPAVGHVVADVERQITSLMAEAHVPGVALVLIRDGRISSVQSFGVIDRASGVPVDADTVFEAASMSKPVFAYAVMQLCERGLLDLDTPLVRYTPDRPVASDPRLDRITARHVLSHTGGFQDWLSGADPLSIHFAPGTEWRYSGEGYYYLQTIVTRLTGRVDPSICASYEADLRVCATDIGDYLDANILQPFGMTLSGYVWNDRLAAHAARPHDENGAPLDKSHPTAADAARYASAGGLHATASDYARFLIEVIDPRPGDRYRVSRTRVDEMLAPVIKVSGAPRPSSWALGWQVLHTPDGDVVAHGGDNRGFHSYAAASVPRRSGFVVMTNGEQGYKLVETLVSETWLKRLVFD